MGKVGRFAFPAALVLAVYYAVFGGEYSVLEVRRARAELQEARAELERLRGENDSIRAWADSLENDRWTIERLAREEHGLVREGEEVIRTTPGSQQDTLPPDDGGGPR